jgi:hypothetical protein
LKTKYTNLKDLKGRQSAIGAILKDTWAQAGDPNNPDFSKVSALDGADTKAKVEKLQALNAELTDVHEDIKEIEMLVKSRQRADEMAGYTPGAVQEQPSNSNRKSLGQIILEKRGEITGQGKAAFLPDVDLKADFFLATTMGWPAESTRLPGFTAYPTRPIAVVDRIPSLPTTQNLVKYMKETVFTNTAAEKAEAAAGDEATLTLAESSDEVEKITVYIPVSEEQLEDVPAAAGYLDNRLTFMIRQRLDGQILEGNGATPNLLGTLSLGALQAQALGTDPRPDAIYKAFDLVRTVGFTEPSDLFINASDWQPIRLLRTADGIYIFGSPLDVGPTRIWGIPVTVTAAVTANTALVGDYANFSTLFIRKGIEVEMSSGYSDYFIKGKFAVKATMRAAMVHFRIPAFAKITGL